MESIMTSQSKSIDQKQELKPGFNFKSLKTKSVQTLTLFIVCPIDLFFLDYVSNILH